MKSDSALLVRTLIVGLAVFSTVATTIAENPPTLDRIRQLGTTSSDSSSGASADGFGNVYISGSTRGNLGGMNAGNYDAFIAKYDTNGAMQWTRQLGTASYDYSYGVSADDLGNVYIAGETNGDAYVAKYDAVGNLQWTRQLGSNSAEAASDVSADGLGNVYISGWTNGSLGGPHSGDSDAFVAKYDAAGALQWTRQLGTASYDQSRAVSADGLGNVYIAGGTSGELGGAYAGRAYDAFVAKYDAAGALQWTRQLGTAESDYIWGLSTDGLGNIYLAGNTDGALAGANLGSYDAFLSKYNSAGVQQWTRQFGTVNDDAGLGVSADGNGNIYLSGNTAGLLDVSPFGGRYDAFLRKYDSAGVVKWTRQLGTDQMESGSGVSADGAGNVYLAGSTGGNLGGPSAGGDDVFLAKFSDMMPGDFNLDGAVDGRDFLLWQRDSSIGSLADWQANYGTPGLAAVTTSSQAVPEPGVVLMLWPLAIIIFPDDRCRNRRPNSQTRVARLEIYSG